MKIDFSVVLFSLEAEPFTRVKTVGDKVESVNMTLGHACAQSLLGMIDEDKMATGVQKYDRWKLASKIITEKVIDLTVEEIVSIKDRVGKVYGPAQIGPIFNILEDKKPDGK